MRIENAGEKRIGRGACRGEEGLKSQIENAGEEGMGRISWREEGGLKSQIAKRRGGGDREWRAEEGRWIEIAN